MGPQQVTNLVEINNARCSVPVRLRRWTNLSVWSNRPRLSLLTGSVLVLVTIFLPVASEQCGPNRTGSEYLLGEGNWPGFLSRLFGDAGRS
jgi:hypothetical protein